MKNIPPPHTSYSNRVVERYSGMELFRIIAMFLVLVVHAGFFSLGAPSYEDMMSHTTSSFARVFFQSLSIGCVDMFVLLSGWFGIRPKFKGIAKFVFQCLFFLIGIYIVCLATGLSTFSIKGVAGCFLLLKWNWFIKAYLLLYILAPVLNTFIDGASRRQFLTILICFFLFQTVYSWGSDAAEFFKAGYSTISFIGLYLLARYVAVFKPKISNYGRWVYLAFFIISVVVMSVAYYLSAFFQLDYLTVRILRYDQPLVIISALSLVVYFSKLDFTSKFVNWVASSSFAVFLLHTNPNLCRQYFSPVVRWLYENNNGIGCLTQIFLFLVIVFIMAIILDQPRKYLWSKIEKVLKI